MVSLHGRTRLKGGDQAHAQPQNKIGHVSVPYKVSVSSGGRFEWILRMPLRDSYYSYPSSALMQKWYNYTEQKHDQYNQTFIW